MLVKIWMIFWIIIVNDIKALTIGVIQHGLLINSNVTPRVIKSNCDECVCLMSIDSIMSMNCISNQRNSYVTCELFSDQFNLNLNSSQIKINLSGSFYYMNSNQTTSINTTSPACSVLGHGNVTRLNSSTPYNWTQYSYNYTATTTTLTLMFGFQTGLGCDYYLDDVSAVNINISDVQLLINPSFENSIVVVNGWNVWCTDTCQNSNTNLNKNSKSHLSTGTCLRISCRNSISFISQSIRTTVGHTYSISYWLSTQACDDSRNQFYFDLF